MQGGFPHRIPQTLRQLVRPQKVSGKGGQTVRLLLPGLSFLAVEAILMRGI